MVAYIAHYIIANLAKIRAVYKSGVEYSASLLILFKYSLSFRRNYFLLTYIIKEGV